MPNKKKTTHNTKRKAKKSQLRRGENKKGIK